MKWPGKHTFHLRNSWVAVLLLTATWLAMQALGITAFPAAAQELGVPQRQAESEQMSDPEEQRLELAVAEKLDSWRQRRSDNCRDKAMREAIPMVDSMVVDYARAQNLMLDRPGKPLRPVEPVLRRPADSLSLAPFIPDSF